MAIGEYLPPVVTRLTGDIGDLIAKVEQAKAVIKSLGDTSAPLNFELNEDSLARAEEMARVFVANAEGVTIPVGADLNLASFERIEAAAKLIAAENPVTVPVEFDVRADQAAKIAASLAGLKSWDALMKSVSDQGYQSTIHLAQADLMLDEANRVMSDGVVASIHSEALLADGMDHAAAATDKVAAATGRSTGRWWMNWNAIHWIVGVSAELLAVLIPATVAFGAFASVALQGTANAATHMWSLWQACEATNAMFGETLGTALGLKDALQKAQNAANPMVYAVLGAALGIAKGNFMSLAGVGLDVMKIFDEFAARMRYDFGPGGAMSSTMQTLLSAMVPDLVELGQTFANLGHFIANFASAMPGLAEVLLRVLDVVTGFLARITNNGLARWLITITIGFEESYRWGGLFAKMLSSVVGLAAKSAGAIGSVASALGSKGVSKAAGGAEDALGGVSKALQSNWAWAAVTAAVVGGFLVYKFLTAKTAAQNFADSLQSVTLKANDLYIFGTIAQNIGTLSEKEEAAKNVSDELGKATAALGSQSGVLGAAAGLATKAYQTFSAALRQQIGDYVTVGQGARYLASFYKTSFTGALELAQAANVNLATSIKGNSEAASVNRLKIADLVQGYQAMGQSFGIVGRDMSAISIESMLQASKVTQLNQAWDGFMQNLTGGTSTLGEIVTEIQNMGDVTTSSAKKFGEDQGNYTLSINGIAKALTSFSATGSQAWQNFDTITSGSAEQMIDWLRTAGTEGELSGSQFTQAVRDMLAQLIPFASKSQAATAILGALAYQAGGPSTDNFKTLKAWVDGAHTSMGNFGSIIDSTTTKMANLSQVAQNLGAVTQTDIIDQMASAKLAVDGVGTATANYTRTAQNNNSTITQIHSTYDNLVQVLTQVTGSNKLANQIAQTYARSVGDDNEQTVTYSNNVNVLKRVLSGLTSKTITIDIKGIGQWQIAQVQGEQGHAHAFAAAGGMVRGGTPGRDSVHAMVMPGEVIVPTHMVKAGWVDHLRGKLPGFAAGGIVPSYSGSIPGESPWAQNDYKATISKFASNLAGQASSAMSAAVHGMSGGGDQAAITAGRQLASALYGWTGSQWLALYDLWERESGWNPNAVNASSGAYGIPQSLGHGHPYALGDYTSQILWGLNYIKERYGSPMAAWGHEVSSGWYDNGGFLAPGLNFAMNGTGGPERVIGPNEEIVVPVTVYLDSKVLYKGVQKQALRTQTRTGTNGLTKVRS